MWYAQKYNYLEHIENSLQEIENNIEDDTDLPFVHIVENLVRGR